MKNLEEAGLKRVTSVIVTGSSLLTSLAASSFNIALSSIGKAFTIDAISLQEVEFDEELAVRSRNEAA